MNAGAASTERTGFETLRKYLELIRFSHTLFALPFALLATVWAFAVPLPNSLQLSLGQLSSAQLSSLSAQVPAGEDVVQTASLDTSHSISGVGDSVQRLPFRVQDIAGILLCMVFARSFAMAVNRLLDHRIDGQNPRTAQRHLPAGTLTRGGVLMFCIVTAALFVAGTCLFLPNVLPLYLSLPVLAFLGGYSLTKRFTRLAHFWLGIALMLAPVCVWIALRGQYLSDYPWDIAPAVWLGGMVMFWTAGFDIIYACQDYEYDRDAGLHSIPAKLGIERALTVAKACHVVMWLMAIAMPFIFPALGLGWLYGAAMILVGGLLFWEHQSVSAKSLDKINLAFFQLNALISVLFLAVGTIDSIL